MTGRSRAGKFTSTDVLAAFAAELSFDDIPAPVVQHAKLCLLDTFGCALFGSTLPWSAILRSSLEEVDPGGPALAWGTGIRLSSPHAALVNGTAVHAFELDDLHPQSIVHPGSVVVPAAIAAGAHTGRQLLTACVAGYEVAARVGMTMGAAHLRAGWHPTGTHGTLGAAAAAGSALGLLAGPMREALGIAGSQSSGLMAAQFESMVKRFHAGRAAQSGLYAALLAARGFTGIANLFEESYGGYGTTFSPEFNPAALIAGLGCEWETSKVGFKPYSTNGSCHPAIDALLGLAAETVIRTDNVRSVDLYVSTATMLHVGWDYEPASITTAQMNLPYIVAVVLTDGDAFVDQFTEERVRDPQLVALSKRVHVHADHAIDAEGDISRHSTRLEITLNDTRVLSDERRHAKGSEHHPLSREDVEVKYMKLAQKCLTIEQARRVVSLVDELETLDDVRVLTDSLLPEP